MASTGPLADGGALVSPGARPGDGNLASPFSLASPAMSEHKEDLVPENTDGYKMTQPKHTLAEYQNMDQEDESLARYKASLGLGNGGVDLSDPADPRVCIILSLSMESPGREPVTFDLATPGSELTLRERPFKIKEGSAFTMVVRFKVQHEILSGLHYVQVVKRKGIRLGKESEMIGSYAPNTDANPVHVKRFREDHAPSGIIARGRYHAMSSFVDDDQTRHLVFQWTFEITKNW